MFGIEFVFRLIGMVLFAVAGVYLGAELAPSVRGSPELYAIVLGLLGALVGLVITPFITTRPVRFIVRILSNISAHTLAAGLIGLVSGLVVFGAGPLGDVGFALRASIFPSGRGGVGVGVFFSCALVFFFASGRANRAPGGLCAST